MTEEIKPEPKIPAQDISVLTVIEQHLKSIRSMLSFFVVITLITFGLGACNIFLSL